MHGFDDAAPLTHGKARGPWFKELTKYHWFVLIVAALGWLFDTMDQQLFNLARVPAMRELLAPKPGMSPAQADVDFYGGLATCIFLLGWATGGLGFGILGDRVGRAKTMLWTILVYSLFTGLSAFSYSFWDFAAYRFLTGLGVGGEFAVGVSLVAEVMSPRARPFALGLLQALSAVGNIMAAVISIVLNEMEHEGTVGSAWRYMFVIGTLPALLAVFIRRRLKEPERWQALTDEEVKKKLGSYGEMFRHPVWRRHALIGMLLAFSGVVGLWGIGFFSVDLIRSVFRPPMETAAREKGEAEGDREFVRAAVLRSNLLDEIDPLKLPPPSFLLSTTGKDKDPEALFGAVKTLREKKQPVTADAVLAALDAAEPKQSANERERRSKYLQAEAPLSESVDMAAHAKRITARGKQINYELGFWAAVASVMINIGAFFGIYGFTYVTHFIGRKPAFAISYVAAMISTALVFWYLKTPQDIYWMIPIMGVCQLSLFGGYAIYFPELFPTYLRSTGTSFCYNVGRFVAASGPFGLGLLTKYVFAEHGGDAMRYAGVTMCAVFFVGLIALPFAPETRGKPLPE